MWTLENVNHEVDKYNQYTGYHIPYIEAIALPTLAHVYATIDFNELCDRKYIVHIGDELYTKPQNMQAALLWHEFTHIRDYLEYRSSFQSDVLYILKTYSEFHAENTKIRCLINLKPECFWDNNIEQYSIDVVQEEINQICRNHSIIVNGYLASLQEIPILNELEHGITSFCYMCGMLPFYDSPTASYILNTTISNCPQKYQSLLSQLHAALISRNLMQCIELYKTLLNDVT